MSTDEDTGPRYRKVALNGLPMPDEKPQAQDETDQEKEETYVDAFNLTLRHSTTDIFVPLVGGELSLSVRRNVEPEIWNDRNGLWPDDPTTPPGKTTPPVGAGWDRFDEPFGAGWSSGISPHIQFVSSISVIEASDCPASAPPATYTYVTDEDGTTHRFLIAYAPSQAGGPKTLQFFAMPSGRHEQDAFLTSLTPSNPDGKGFFATFTFKRKFGTTLVFQMVPGLGQGEFADNMHPSSSVVSYSYARVTTVTDRYANCLSYTYKPPNGSLIPDTIASGSIVSNNFQPDGRQLAITHDNLHISAIEDPNGNVTTYSYTTCTPQSGQWGAGVTHTVKVLQTVTRAAGTPEQTTTVYAYSAATEKDSNSLVMSNDPWINYYYHINLQSITVPATVGQTARSTAFTYYFDRSRYNYDSQRGYFAVSGNPMNVRTVQPLIGPPTNFVNNSQVWVTYPVPPAGQTPTPTMSGVRETQVQDAEGHLRTYDFTNSQIFPLNEFENLLTGDGSVLQTPLMIVYGTMTMTLPPADANSPAGTESFQFNPAAGTALAQTTDFSGNSTFFYQDDAWSVKNVYPWLPVGNYPVTAYTDPTRQINAKGGTKYFHYDTTSGFRVMDRVLDEDGRLTVYAINPANGLRTAESIYPVGAVPNGQINANPSGSPSQYTEFTYGNASLPAFMTEKRVHKLAGDPAWATDLVTQYIADGYGHVASQIIDPGGLTLTTNYSYDLNGNKTSVQDPRTNTTCFHYDHLNRLVEVDYPPNATALNPPVKKTFAYDASSNKVRETDENGHSTLFVYDALNRLTDTGRDMNGDGQLTRGGNSTDLVTSYAYNWVNAKTGVEDPNGNQTTMQYDALQRLILKTDPAPLSYSTQYSYTGPNAGGNCFDSSSFKPTGTIDPRGYTTTVAYDPLYRETDRYVQYSLTDPTAVAHTATLLYDGVGNPLQLQDPCGNLTLKTYDALSRVTATTYASGTTDQASESTAYTGTGLAWQVTDGNQQTTTKQYDTAGRAVAVIQPAVDDGTNTGHTVTPTTQTGYDANGNVAYTINPRLFRWDYGYDERNRKITETDPAVVDPFDGTTKRPIKTMGYDLVGNATSVTDALALDQPGLHTTTTRYDHANRPTRTIAPAVVVLRADGTFANVHPRTEKVYDLNGNVLQATDADDNTTINQYDQMNRLVSSVDAAGDPVLYTCDAAGNRVGVQDGTNPGTAFGYDGLNRNTWVQYGSAYSAQVASLPNHSTDFVYDGLNKTGRRDLLGQVTTYGYDHRNRLQSVTYVNRAQDNRTYSHDGDGNILTVSEPGKNGAADVAYTYDALDRMSTETSGGHQHQYSWDPAGNRTIAQYSVNTTPAGRVLASVYDALNRLGSLTEGGRVTAYAYDLDGDVLTKTLPDGEQVVTVYDALHRAGSIEGATASGAILYRYLYHYDAVGNVRRSREYYASLPAQTITMGYDGANRLTEEDTAVQHGATTRVSYGYDGSHNRTTKAVDGVTTTYVFNHLNQLTGWSSAANPGQSYGYDFNGNRTSSTAAGVAASTYGYDYDNRLVGVSQGGTSYAYTYDYRTRRVTRTEGASSTQVVFAGGTSVAEYPLTAGNALSAAGTVASAEYVRGSDWGGGVGGILYSVAAGKTSFDHYNRRGDVVAQTSGNGVVGYQATYEAFGTRPAEQGQDGNRQRANTKEEDPTGLLDEGMRYRDLAAGVFMTKDPAGMIDGPNLYAYVNQNPWTKFDPEGLSTEEFEQNSKNAENISKQLLARRDEAVSSADKRVGEAEKKAANGEISQKDSSKIASSAREDLLKQLSELKNQYTDVWNKVWDRASSEGDIGSFTHFGYVLTNNAAADQLFGQTTVGAFDSAIRQAGQLGGVNAAMAATGAMASGTSPSGEMEGPPSLINQGQQDKHIPGTNNYIAGKSTLTIDPSELARYTGTGTMVNGTVPGVAGSRERVDFGRTIGTYVDQAGNSFPTSKGIIHYSNNGIHIVPARP